VDEACQNIIRHAYGGDPTCEIVLEVSRDADRIVVDLLDFAEPIDHSRIQPRDLDDIRPGGLGTHFIKECMDETEYPPPPEGAGNLLRMMKRIS
jgi:sigma-B regulation protein RsbU (phosphoserine phosphatase)